MSVMYDKVLRRVGKLEDILGANNNKPSIAVELESKMADLRSHVLTATQECQVDIRA